MPVDLTIVESTTELGQTVVEVVLEGASEPGPAGPGVPAGGTTGQSLVKASNADYDTEWDDVAGGGSGAPTDATYLVTAGHVDLDAEVVVGATPGGELGGTWASPTVDASHSGSTHAAVQSAAEATAAAALAAHEADTTGVHGIADTSALALTANHPSNATFNDHSARHENGGADEISIAGLDGIPAELQTHLDDATDAHDASAVSVDSTNLSGAATHVQGSLEELDNLLDDHSARHENGGADEISLAGLDGTPNALQAHLDDTSDAHDASAISVADSGTFYTATDVEGVLAEIAPQLGGGGYYNAYAKLWDEKGNTTDGGGFTSGADRTRDLNQEYDPDGIVTLSSNQFTLQAGTYRIYARAPALQVAAHAALLWNVTDSAIVIDGAQTFSATAAAQAQTDSIVSGEFTIAAQKTFELRHRCQTTKATNGFGTQATAIAAVSIYTEVELWRLA